METHRGGSRPRRVGLLIGASALLATVLLGALVPLATWRPVRPSVALPNGSRVTLEAVTLGNEERILGSPLQQLLYRLLPPGQKELSGAVSFQGSAPGTLTFWASWHGPEYSYDQMEATVFDETGNESPSVTPQGLGNNRQNYEFAAFPRRGGTVGLRFYRRRSWSVDENAEVGRGWERLGEITAPNPEPGPHPRWNAPPLPVTARSGEVEVTLSRLVTGVAPEHTFLLRGPAEVYCLASLQVTSKGQPTPDWTASIRSVSDATGNSWNVGASTTTEERTLFPCPPWPGENAWKLRLQLNRTQTARYAPEELWEVRDLPIPARGVSVPLGRKNTVQGVSLELIGVYGPGARLPGDHDVSGHEGVPRLLLRVAEGTSRDLYRSPLRTGDERGRGVSFNLAASKGGGRESHELYRIEAAPGAKRFTFRYAVHPVRYVEILAPKTR